MTQPDDTAPVRRVLLLAHTGRAEAREVARAFVESLSGHGLHVRLMAQEAADLDLGPDRDGLLVEVVDGEPDAGHGCELAVVIGGDGTILRAAEITHGSGTPVLGINLGHVGFLAEAERDDLAELAERVATQRYDVEERLTLDVDVTLDGDVLGSTWAVNEATVEKSDRERMIEVALVVDGRPLTEFGCDGVVLSTPTGSTAYAFSAGGPVVWPELEALLVVPIAAHALFARPLVIGPESVLEVHVLRRTGKGGVLWCDGRRSVPLPAGARVVVRRSATRIRLARLARPPFTDRLVAKFGLPVAGWRGHGAGRVGTDDELDPRA